MSEREDPTDQAAGMVSVPARKKKKRQSGDAEIESWMMCFAPQKSNVGWRLADWRLGILRQGFLGGGPRRLRRETILAELA